MYLPLNFNVRPGSACSYHLILSTSIVLSNHIHILPVSWHHEAVSVRSPL
jgi:hypothetical protein